MTRTIPARIVSRARQRLIVGDEAPTVAQVKIRWAILRRARAAIAKATGEAGE